jgi:hypothetical protein
MCEVFVCGIFYGLPIMFNVHLALLVTTAASLASGQTVNILDYTGKALNIDLSPGPIDFGPGNVFPFVSTANEQAHFLLSSTSYT